MDFTSVITPTVASPSLCQALLITCLDDSMFCIHRLYTPYGCETAACAHTWQCLDAHFALLELLFVYISQ